VSWAVFAYGTLEAPEVVERVLGRRLPTVAAHLHGYARYRLRDRLYPGIVRQEGAMTAGTLLEEVRESDLVRLDAFEDALYERLSVQVALEETGETRTAFTYVVRPAYVDLLSAEAWSRQRFLRDWLSIFLESE